MYFVALYMPCSMNHVSFFMFHVSRIVQMQCIMQLVSHVGYHKAVLVHHVPAVMHQNIGAVDYVVYRK